MTVDVRAAIGSELYFEAMTQSGAWTIQKKATATSGAGEETAYTDVGATDNGLLVILAACSSSDGSGDFITLHVLDVAAARASDLSGKIYIDLADLRRGRAGRPLGRRGHPSQRTRSAS